MKAFYFRKKRCFLLLLAAVAGGINSMAQSSTTLPKEDFKPSITNQPGKLYPQVNSENRVRASISAPQALKVQLDIGGKKYDMVKDEKAFG